MSGRSGNGRELDAFEVGSGTLGFVAALYLFAVALEPTLQTHAIWSWLPFLAPLVSFAVATIYWLWMVK